MIDIPEEAQSFLLDGKIVAAVKVVREKNNIGLKEAKDAIDLHVKENPGIYPEMKTISISPRMVATFVVLLLGLIAYLLLGAD